VCSIVGSDFIGLHSGQNTPSAEEADDVVVRLGPSPLVAVRRPIAFCTPPHAGVSWQSYLVRSTLRNDFTGLYCGQDGKVRPPASDSKCQCVPTIQRDRVPVYSTATLASHASILQEDLHAIVDQVRFSLPPRGWCLIGSSKRSQSRFTLRRRFRPRRLLEDSKLTVRAACFSPTSKYVPALLSAPFSKYSDATL
jgi:hypothetical protein